MSSRRPARAGTRRVRSTIAAAVVVVSAVLIVLAAPSLDLSSGDAGPAVDPALAAVDPSPAVDPGPALEPGPVVIGRPPGRPARALGEADGSLPEGVTAFDDQHPGVAGLDAALLGALRRAATDAADDDVELHVNSGWRSAAYQEQLLREAISQYGSAEEAARWVATPDTSAHVSGDAVDIGPADATAWLSEHGARYGLCRVYRNEPWHYELRPDAADRGCPAMYADPTHDPRMPR